ncbi:tol-pal system protein YbgF [Alcaligenaceae bacterium SJ-26]|nr:tol-pal system protein YbgF [Alcaligenaceae bacterium SJ-26]
MRLFSRSVLATALLAILPLQAHAFADDESRRAILELRQQIQQMTEQNQRARLQLADQIESLRQEITRLRNQVEHLDQQAAQASARNAPPDDGTPRVSDEQEQQAYDDAIDHFRNGRYREAAELMTAFTALYPSSALEPLARFYLGSSHYALKDYKAAIESLDAMLKSAPTNPRAPDALLVIAGSQIELGDYAAAKTSLQRIVREYPGTPAAETANNRLQLLR